MATTWIVAADASRARILQVMEFLGQLRKELGQDVEKLVAGELPKDLSWLNARDLEQKYFGSNR